MCFQFDRTDALGRVATYETDALGRTTHRTDKLGGQTLTTTWTWDTAPNGIGRLHSVVSPDGAKTYGYNKRGQTESIKLGVNGDVFSARLGYDDLGRMTSLDYPQPLGVEPFGVTRDYDAHGFVVGVRDKATNDAYWELTDVDDAGRLSEELFGNGTKTVRTYHSDNQTLKSITTTRGASTIQQLSYDWDPRLNLKSRTDTLQPQDKTERFRYDAFGQRRNVVWGAAPPASFANSKVKPGFTAHDEQDEFGLVNMRGRLFDPKIGRFTTTDPVIANVHDGQSFGAYGYVRNNPLAFVDPSGFTEEEAWRQWRFEEAPGQVGVHVTFDKLTPPAPRPTPQSMPVADADVNTTGAGDEGLSENVPSVEPIPARPDFWDGVEDGGIDALAGLPSLIPTETTTVIAQIQGTLAVIDAYENGDAIDAINVVNPAMPFATLGFAIDDGDWYTVGRSGVGVGVTIVGAIVGKRLMGGNVGIGPKSGSAAGPGSGKRVSVAQRRLALDENEGSCVFCGRPATEADHSIPRSRGGDTTTGPQGNLQPTCQHCNRQKGPKTSNEYLDWLQRRKRDDDGH